MTPTTDELSARLDDLDAAHAAAVDRFLELAAGELHDVLEQIAHLDERRRATAHQLGIPVRRPPARELAAEVLHHAARDLQPYLPLVCASSADRAAASLQLPTRDLELATDSETSS